MNNDTGATPMDIQRGICETGSRGGESVSIAKREDACLRAGMSTPSDQLNTFFIAGSSILVLLLIAVLGYSVFKRMGGRKTNKSLL